MTPLQAIITANILALTLPISLRAAVLLADWFDEKLEDWQRKKQ